MLPFALGLLLTTSPAKDLSGIRWIHDDWTRAKQTAKKQNKLVAVDVWATWCHTCLSMKNYVLKRAPLAKVRGQHTWLSLDYDKEENAAFFEVFPIGAFPTFLVIDPRSDQIVARWVGSGTAEEMTAFFADAGRSTTEALSRGQKALARRRYGEARRIFEAALTKEKLDRATKTRMVSGLMEALYKTDKKACARKIAPYLNEVDDTAPGLDAVAMAAYCADALKKKEKEEILAKVATRLAPVVKNDALHLSVDDRSSLYGTLVSAYDTLGKKKEADEAAKARLALLEAAARKAKTPAARATFDYHRMEVYLRFKRYDEAERMLTASEKAQPKDFNHPWRLAIVYLKKGAYDRGLEAIERALKNGYGGRKIRLYSTKIDLLLAKKDLRRARATVAEGKKALAAVNESQVRDYWRKEFESKVTQVKKQGGES